MFPLPTPDDNAVKAMNKSWSRTDLERYLQRWERCEIQALPEALHDFAWRGLDVGCGFGRYLLRESPLHPERGYLGIDKGQLRGGNMIKRFAESGQKNLFGIHGNVIPVLAGFPDGYFDQVTIFYPNPWWPTKHRKKRWSYHPLLPKLISVLKPGGEILLTSNEAFYLGEWVYALQHHPRLPELQLSYAGPIQEEGRTHFEAKFIEEGTPAGEVRFVKS